MKTPRFDISKAPNGKGYRITIPAAFSPTGKRYRPTYPDLKTAKIHQAKLRAEARLFGENQTTLTPGEAEDARRAIDELKGAGATLLEAARSFVKAREAEEASVTLRELWKEHEASREGTAANAYMKEIRRIGKKLVKELGEKLVCDIPAAEVEKTLDRLFPTGPAFNVAYRTIRPAWTLALQRGYARENVFERFNQKRVKLKDEPDFLTVPQVKAVLNACTDHSKNTTLAKSYRIDCTDCRIPFALLTFAGIRPDQKDGEIVKLHWDAIDLEARTIKIGTGVAKGGRLRFVEIQDNLAAWLESVPLEERTGRIVPPSWQTKYKAVRSAAGIGHLQDILRHTFATYRSPTCDQNSLLNDMGHGTPKMTLARYRGLAPKHDVVRFWRIGPEGELPAIREAVA